MCPDEFLGKTMTDTTINPSQLRHRRSTRKTQFHLCQTPGLLKLTIVNFLLGLITLGVLSLLGQNQCAQTHLVVCSHQR